MKKILLATLFTTSACFSDGLFYYTKKYNLKSDYFSPTVSVFADENKDMSGFKVGISKTYYKPILSQGLNISAKLGTNLIWAERDNSFDFQGASIDAEGRLGYYISSSTSIYALGGVEYMILKDQDNDVEKSVGFGIETYMTQDITTSLDIKFHSWDEIKDIRPSIGLNVRFTFWH